MNFTWSLKPIFIWFVVIFGIDLDRSKKTSKSCLNFMAFLCLFWFICISIPLNGYYIVTGISLHSDAFNLSLVYIISNKINWILVGILGISFHASIIVSAFGKWKSLWENFKQMQEAIGDESAFYQQLRHRTNRGLIIIFMVNVIHAIHSFISWFIIPRMIMILIS